MYHLDIPKTRQYDNGKIEIIARSSVGEARTETTLNVKPRSDDYRGVLKSSPRRKCGYNSTLHTQYQPALHYWIWDFRIFNKKLKVYKKDVSLSHFCTAG